MGKQHACLLSVKEHRWNGWFRINKCECNPIRPLYGGWCNISCYFIVKQSINLYNHLLLLHILFETYSMHSCTCPYVECSFGYPLSWCFQTTLWTRYLNLHFYCSRTRTVQRFWNPILEKSRDWVIRQRLIYNCNFVLKNMQYYIIEGAVYKI